MAFWETVMTSSRSKGLPYGKRLVPVLVDQYAREEPDRVCFSFPRSSEIEDGFQDMTFETFANAINKTARFIHREIGRSAVFETVLYMGYPDVRHFIVLVALMKTGHKVLFSSHRNSVAGHADLIKRTDCTVLLHSAGFPVGGIVEKCRLETLCMPELDYLLDDSIKCEHYPYTWTFEEAKSHPCLVVHTSGSTGLPKPVVWTQESLALTDNQHTVPDLDGRPTIWATLNDQVERHFSAIPIFHGAGIACGIIRCLYNKNTVVLPPQGLVTAEIFDKVLDHGNIDDASCIPITLEEVATRPDILAKIKRLKKITYAGGSLTSQAGNIISKHAHLYSILGSIESNTLVQHVTDRSDWQYICLNPNYNGIEMRNLPTASSSTSPLHELIFVNDPAKSSFPGVFKVFPHLEEYSTSDLFSAHPDPSKPHHWKHESRTDDMIVFNSGCNFNPRIHEHLIASHPAVQACILIGTGRHCAAVIIELRNGHYTEDDGEKEKVLDEIWPMIQRANAVADTIGQLRRDYVIFASKERPFGITGKGTVQRGKAVKMYKKEIEEIYRRARDGSIEEV